MSGLATHVDLPLLQLPPRQTLWKYQVETKQTRSGQKQHSTNYQKGCISVKNHTNFRTHIQFFENIMKYLFSTTHSKMIECVACYYKFCEFYQVLTQKVCTYPMRTKYLGQLDRSIAWVSEQLERPVQSRILSFETTLKLPIVPCAHFDKLLKPRRSALVQHWPMTRRW